MGTRKNEIIVCGDTHAEWGYLNKLITRHRPYIILQCGDWGWWPKFDNTYALSWNGKKWHQRGVKNLHQDGRMTFVYWCPGNHEDWWDLVNEQNKHEGPVEVQPGVFYMKRGEILRLPDGRNVLFMGGADSIDKELRTIGRDWFPDEIITQADIYNLPDPDETTIDIVISHTCPREFHDEIMQRENSARTRAKFEDPSMMALSYILHTYQPSLWYFGHFHLFKKGTHVGENWACQWTCLDMAPHSMWWEILKER